MRKTLYIITTVAILGILATYASSGTAAKKSSTLSVVQPSAVASTATTGNTASTTPTPAANSTPTTSTNSSGLKDGSFTGGTYSNRYGDVQVAINISSGQITSVKFVQLTAYDQHSQEINSYASGQLKQETLSAQSANIDGVSGASFTSESYIQSLQSAIDKAKS